MTATVTLEQEEEIPAPRPVMQPVEIEPLVIEPKKNDPHEGELVTMLHGFGRIHRATKTMLTNLLLLAAYAETCPIKEQGKSISPTKLGICISSRIPARNLTGSRQVCQTHWQ